MLRPLNIAAFLALAAPSPASAQHLGPVTDIAAGNGAVYSCSLAGIVVTAPDGTRPRVLVKPSFRVTSIAATAHFLFIGGGVPGESGVLAVYDLDSGELREAKIARDLVYAVDVAPSGKGGAAACADHRVLRITLPVLAEDRIETRHRHTGPARAVQFSPDGKWLASAGLDGAILLSRADGEGDPQVLQDHSAKVDSLAWSPDSSHFASGARDGRVRIHAANGRLVRTYQGIAPGGPLIANRAILSLAWAPGALVAGTAAGELHRLSASDDSSARLAALDGDPVFSIGISSAGGPLLHAGTNRPALRLLPLPERP